MTKQDVEIQETLCEQCFNDIHVVSCTHGFYARIYLYICVCVCVYIIIKPKNKTVKYKIIRLRQCINQLQLIY